MMASHFCISVRFLQPLCHGRGDGGEPEWPPSPLRLFQAVVAAAAARWNERIQIQHAIPALRWLEQHNSPVMIAPGARTANVSYRLYVPDNVGDQVAASWCRGGSASMADYRTEKDVRPTHLNGEAIHYLYPISENDQEFANHRETLVTAARSITHLGWGIDMVAADAAVVSQVEADKLAGERWVSTSGSSVSGLRVPRPGTLDDLIRKHDAFLSRLVRDARGNESFNPVPPLSVYTLVGYRRATEPKPREWAAFSILTPDASGYRPFETTRRTRDVAGMVRSCVARLAKIMRPFGWSDEQINVFVHGKTPDGQHPVSGQKSPDRFHYLPLPSINHQLNRVESIRRVLVAAPAHCRQHIEWLRRTLAGAELRNDHSETAGLLTILPGSDWVLRQYVGESTSWCTVTPVILPIHEGYDGDTAGEWLMTAFEQAGYATELMSRSELEWRRVGFRAGVDLASRYLPPKNLDNKPRYHVRVRFPHPISGPLVVGSGRFRGFGLFARMDEKVQERPR